jgi:hypothetical protein
MVTTYLVVKLVHILLAIAAVGFTSTFGITMATAAARPTALPFALTAIRRLQTVSSPAFLGLIATGLLMAWLGSLDWKALWFSGSLTIALASVCISLFVARPTLMRQIQLLEQPPGDELKRLAARSRKVGLLLSFAALTIIGLMVFKPTL